MNPDPFIYTALSVLIAMVGWFIRKVFILDTRMHAAEAQLTALTKMREERMQADTDRHKELVSRLSRIESHLLH